MRVKKKQWIKEREVYPAFCGRVKAQGNSATITPAIPQEYVGKKVIVVIMDEDREIFLKKIGEGVNDDN